MKKLFKGILFAAFAIMSIFALVSCGEQAIIPDPVDASTIKYDGKTFTWTAPNNASTYLVSVNEAATELTLTNTKHSYTAKAKDETVLISIKSVSSDGNIAETPAVKTFTRLATVTNVVFDEVGNMSWDSVDGATAYIVKINNKEKTVATTELEHTEFEVGKLNNIQVRAYADDGFSDFSKSVSKTYLAAPTNIKYNGSEISWYGSSAAKKYEVFINGQSFQIVDKSPVIYDAENTTFKVTVKALGDSGVYVDTFSSEESAEVEYKYLDTVREIRVVDGQLQWDAIDKASGYEVRIGHGATARVETVKAPEYTKVVPGQSQSYAVKPIVDDTDNYFSAYCEERSIRVLAKPQLKWKNDWDLQDGVAQENLYWDAESSQLVAGYEVKLEFQENSNARKVPIDTDGTNKQATSFKYGYEQTGIYTVSVRAIADKTSGIDYDSAYSDELTIVRLAAPSKNTATISSTADNYAEGFFINFQSISGADRYILYKDGTEVPGSKANYNLTDQIQVLDFDDNDDQRYENHKFTYSLQSHGPGYNSKTGIVYLSSLKRNDALTSFEITILGTPQDVHFSGENAIWTGVDGAKGYKVLLNNYDDVDHPNYSLENLGVGEATFKVCAKGNGADMIASKYTDGDKVVRLAAPSRGTVQIVRDGEEYKLEWGKVEHAKSYNVLFDGQSTATNANGDDGLTAIFDNDGVHVRIQAWANEYASETDRTYYVSSKYSQTCSFIKLQAPTFGDQLVTNNKLHWNKPSNVSSDAYTPTYQVYDANHNTMLDSAAQGTEFDLHRINGGDTYSFRIRALGDQVNYIDSDLSAAKTFDYLATPVVERVENRYEWLAVEGCEDGYTLTINGTPVENISSKVYDFGTKYSYTVDLQHFSSVNADYQIEVIAKGNAGYTIVASEPCSFIQHTEEATAPEFKISYKSTSGRAEENGLIVTEITTESDHALRYVVSYGIEKTIQEKNTDGKWIDEYKPGKTGEYTIKVQSVGGVFSNDVLYKNSQWTSSKTVIILEKPSIEAPATSWIKINNPGSTTTVNARNGFAYKVIVSVGNQDYTVEGTTETERILYSALLQAIRAKYEVASDFTFQSTNISYVSVYAYSYKSTESFIVVDSQTAELRQR